MQRKKHNRYGLVDTGLAWTVRVTVKGLQVTRALVAAQVIGPYNGEVIVIGDIVCSIQALL